MEVSSDSQEPRGVPDLPDLILDLSDSPHCRLDSLDPPSCVSSVSMSLKEEPLIRSVIDQLLIRL